MEGAHSPRSIRLAKLMEHIYVKVGVSTRVGAALYAMEHDLVEDRRARR